MPSAGGLPHTPRTYRPRSGPNPVLDLTRPRDLFPGAHRASCRLVAMPAGQVSWVVRRSAMSFEFDAQRYQRASAHQQEWGQRLIAELDLQGHECILDVGSGDGSLTRKLAAAVPRGSVLGIDASARMVEAAQELAEPALRFVRMDILDAEFQEEFDVVFSSATLHWLKDHRRLLGVLYRAVKPGGVVRLNFGGEGNCSHLITILQKVMRESAYRMAFRGFVWPWYMPNVESYERLVREFPFSSAWVWGEVADR